ncbi:asparagine synthetase B family protein [Rhodospirillum sp. A1_3_36]|uniref:asparagine synthetase B family protein n=1 Tax=Rhodospirillum sp. A1_3_36 TaxID=3391666 RepID=UPI0039A4843C
MLSAIAHRGDPEHFGEMATTPLATIGTNRLAIVDPDHGRQPFCDPATGLWCVMNGEVYNHAELRRLVGGEWRSRCDTEVVMEAYRAWGDDFVHRLDGMFAICLVDAARGRVLLGRDPLGIKPLYIARSVGGVAFCSEAKGLAALSGVTAIEAIPAGSLWTGGKATRYFQLPEFAPSAGLPETDLLAGLADALTEAVGSCLPEADEEVACLLSGGVDSSTVLMLAARARPGRVRAFTFAAPGANSSDLAAAHAVCTHLGVPLTEVSPSAGTLTHYYLEEGVRMAETFEPALVRNAVSYHFLCRAVRAAGFKWCLSGEGADEVFGGYDYFKQLPLQIRDAAIRDSLEDIHRTYLQMADRASMAASVEVRVPYMERRFVEAAARLPPDFRIRGDRDKWGLRNAFPGALPDAILARAKSGMNKGAGFGGNDPGESIYSAAVSEFYSRHPSRLAADRALVVAHPAFAIDRADTEESYNFARFIECGLQKISGSGTRPQLNTSHIRPSTVPAPLPCAVSS